MAMTTSEVIEMIETQGIEFCASVSEANPEVLNLELYDIFNNDLRYHYKQVLSLLGELKETKEKMYECIEVLKKESDKEIQDEVRGMIDAVSSETLEALIAVHLEFLEKVSRLGKEEIGVFGPFLIDETSYKARLSEDGTLEGVSFQAKNKTRIFFMSLDMQGVLEVEASVKR